MTVHVVSCTVKSKENLYSMKKNFNLQAFIHCIKHCPRMYIFWKNASQNKL